MADTDASTSLVVGADKPAGYPLVAIRILPAARSEYLDLRPRHPEGIRGLTGRSVGHYPRDAASRIEPPAHPVLGEKKYAA